MLVVFFFWGVKILLVVVANEIRIWVCVRCVCIHDDRFSYSYDISKTYDGISKLFR